MSMLIEREDGQVVLSIDGADYHPDDVLPDGAKASDLVEGALMDGSYPDVEVAQRFLKSKKRRRNGHPRNPDCPVVISAKVPKKVKEWYREEAERQGVKMGGLVARVLNEKCDRDPVLTVSHTRPYSIGVIAEARASVALDHDERMQTCYDEPEEAPVAEQSDGQVHEG